jgi:hypothetical protein
MSDTRITLRIKPAHLATWQASAERARRSLSDWMRVTLQERVDAELDVLDKLTAACDPVPRTVPAMKRTKGGKGNGKKQ